MRYHRVYLHCFAPKILGEVDKSGKLLIVVIYQKKTVNNVLKRAEELGSFWLFDENETDAGLVECFFFDKTKRIY